MMSASQHDSANSRSRESHRSVTLRSALTTMALLRIQVIIALATLAAVLCLESSLHAQTTLSTTNYRHSANVGSNSVYDYTPTIMQDGKYRMWWCGAAEGPGDNILYAESTSLSGPFTAPNGTDPYLVVFRGTNDGTSFDSEHTCDPSVIRVNGTYYMYYGGLQKDSGPLPTEIGLAQSSDGITWTRMNNGNAIIVPAELTTGNAYGAGQPSVIYLNGYFYVVYTDTTGLGGTPQETNAVYVVRSTDPTFQSGVQELTATGFQSQTSSNHTTYALLNTASVDWTYIDSLQVFAVAEDHGSDPNNTYIHFFSTDLLSIPYNNIAVAGTWVDGPGIVTRPDKHALPPMNSACGTTSFDFIKATSLNGNGAPDNLQDFGVDILSGLTCASISNLVANMFEGYAIQAPGFPLTLDIGGVRLQSASTLPIQDLTKNFINTSSEIFYDIPYGASLQVGAQALGASGRPAGFLLDNNTLWLVDSIKILTDNSSSITTIPTSEWDTYSHGPDLHLVQ